VSDVTDAIRVLIVDDSPFVRRAVERMLGASNGMTIVGFASDGREGVEQVGRLRPDVVILDIVMPRLDGLEAIREIMARYPTPILVLSSETRPGAEITIKALELGAVDFLSKTQAGGRMDIYDLAPLLREKVRAIAGSRIAPPAPTAAPASPVAASAPAPPRPGPVPRPAPGAYQLLVIGASTGGPRALAELLAELPADLPLAILVAQHMPHGFTATLAQRLDRRSGLHVREARDEDAVEPGVVLIGVGGRHLRVERQGGSLVARVDRIGNGHLHRPSVDVLFTSAAEVSGDRTIGLVLTGMGDDGAAGLAAIRQAGGRTLVESEESAVIYGMPRAAREWAERVLPLYRMPAAILELVGTGADR
jgi:two-component system, chemotaxis family, protein-glutamate methylesterase/glutaminase